MNDGPPGHPPISQLSSPGNAVPPFREQARLIFVAWEWLRIPFNVILIVLVLSLTRLKVEGGLLILLIQGAVIANILYMAGPSVETYVRWLGGKSKGWRIALFAGGLSLTAVLAWAVIIAYHLKDF